MKLIEVRVRFIRKFAYQFVTYFHQLDHLLRDLKYLLAYLIPALSISGMLLGGIWTYSVIFFGFVLMPIIETFLPNSPKNFSEDEAQSRKGNRLFDVFLYLNLPLIYIAIALFAYLWLTADLQTWEWVGNVASLGVLLGASGVNVAHELGHRKTKFERFIAKSLLLPSFYMHFIIEHNRGHHKNVGTDHDPSSARLNEWLYVFWIRSTVMTYLSAWKLEAIQLNKKGHKVISIHNEMIRFQLIQAAYLVGIIWLLGPLGALLIVLAGTIGFLLLETINYIEHYGLRRKKTGPDSYERVQPIHSWNSNYELGRIILYELTRHADHHYLAHKKYQLLDHHEKAPELPVGYPGSMLLALIPPLWITVMNKRIKDVDIS